MLFKFKPEVILVPSLTIISFVLFGIYFYENFPFLVVAFGAFLTGLYAGSFWRGASDLWENQIWSFFKDGVWISERAREWGHLQNRLLFYWFINFFLRFIFFVLIIGFGGLNLIVMFKLIDSGLSAWVSIPLGIIVSSILTFFVMGPYLFYKTLAEDENNIFGKMESLLSKYKNLSDELEKLKKWESEQKILVTAGKFVVNHSEKNDSI